MVYVPVEAWPGAITRPLNDKVAGINAQLGAGIEGETHQLSRRILQFADGNFTGQGKVQLRRDQLFRQRLVGVHMVRVYYMEAEMDWG